MKVILHLAGEDPILAEMAALPGPTDQYITVRNPRKRDGKPLTYLTDGATSFIWPIARLGFLEIMGGEEDEIDTSTGATNALGGSTSTLQMFFREDSLPKRR